MTLIKSISGIRGTIGGTPGQALTPTDIVKFAGAYAAWLKKRNGGKAKIVIGRDARISGPMVNQIMIGTLMASGIDVLDLGLATTPAVEVAVTHFKAQGGIILTASHNPKQWNALKLLNEKGEFLNDADGKQLLSMADAADFDFVDVDQLGQLEQADDFTDYHVQQVINLPYVQVDLIKKAGFKVVLDAVNSVGGIAIPRLLKALGVTCVPLYCTPNGQFPHNPEPLPEHLTEIASWVVQHKADLGFVVDPDVDRLAIVNEDGSMFGEEYTLVAVADYVLSKNGGGNTVSNLSSSRALRDVTEKHGGVYTASAVGEVNVVSAMKDTKAIIGGEGNGGIIYPAAHYGRDALVGIALFLSHLAEQKVKCSVLRNSYPPYFISKNKVELTPQTDIDALLNAVKAQFKNNTINETDGVRIDFEQEKKWVHMRRSNTEPIIRIYAEASTMKDADALAALIMNELQKK